MYENGIGTVRWFVFDRDRSDGTKCLLDLLPESFTLCLSALYFDHVLHCSYKHQSNSGTRETNILTQHPVPYQDLKSRSSFPKRSFQQVLKTVNVATATRGELGDMLLTAGECSDRGEWDVVNRRLGCSDSG